jgi:hypothetical protein
MSTTPPDFSSLPLDELAKANEEICRFAAQVNVLFIHISQQRPKEFTYQELITRIALEDHLSLAKKEKDKFQALFEENERGWDTQMEATWQLEAYLARAEIDNTKLWEQILSMANKQNPPTICPILDDACWSRKRPKFDDHS